VEGRAVTAEGGTGATVDVRPARASVAPGGIAVAEHCLDHLTKASSSHTVQEEVDGMIHEDQLVINGFRYLHSSSHRNGADCLLSLERPL